MTSPDVPTPASWALEQAFLPQAAQVVAAVESLAALPAEARRAAA